MKNVFKRIINGIFTAGLLSASAFGFVLSLSLIFGEGTALWERVIVAVLFASMFISGFLSNSIELTIDGGEKDSEAKDE